MRHKKSFNHLGRKVGHRNSMLANMASSLILHKRIKTTTAKAKALKVFVEPLITKSKDDSTHSRRVVFSYLQDKNAVSELFREVSPKIADRPGGYTRILKTGTRLGDNADMCLIELVDFNENLLKAKEETAKSGRRRRRGGKKKSEEVTAATATAATTDMEESIETVEEKDEVIETQESAEDITEEKTVAVEEVAGPETDQEVKDEVENKTEAVKEETPAGEQIEAKQAEADSEEKKDEQEAEDSEEKKAE